jgi:phosphatidylinositol dimannoside acyltransferase
MELIRDLLMFFQWTVLAKITRILPLKLAYSLSDFFSYFLNIILLKKKVFLLKVIDEFFPGKTNINDKMRISKSAIDLFVKAQVDVMRYPILSGKNIEDYVYYHGLEHLDRAHEAGKSVILMFGHFGANQFIIPALGHKGYRINQVSTFHGTWEKMSGKKISKLKEIVYKYIKDCESSLPVNFMDIENSVRPVIRCLEKGEILLVAFDGRGGSSWSNVEFLNHHTNISSGPFRIAIKTGSWIIPAYILRQKDNSHLLKIEEPLYTGEAMQPEEIIRKYLDWFESIVRKHPDHYLWLLQAAMIRGKTDPVPLFEIS